MRGIESVLVGQLGGEVVDQGFSKDIEYTQT